MSQLSPTQQSALEGARRTLAEVKGAGTDTYSLAKSVGALEWRLADVISLVEQLTGNAT